MEHSKVIASLRKIINEAQGTLNALEQNGAAVVSGKEIPLRDIAWGSRVSSTFKASVLWIEDQIGLSADKLMNCIAFETGTTFDPAIKNMAGSSGTGLIQFMRSTAIGLGTTVEELAAMSAERQLGYVYKYFKPFGSDLSGWTQEDIYMAILYPKAIGKPLDWAMPWKYGSLAYKQNSGLDLNKDRKITKQEASAGIRKMAVLGERLKG